jgi:hypothetical protein
MTTIARINNESIIFQSVDSFDFVSNSDIQMLTVDEAKRYSDPNGSGNTWKASFADAVSEVEFDLRLNAFGLNMKRGCTVSSYQAEVLKREITQLMRVERSVEKAVQDIGCYMGSVQLYILLNILFKKLKVIGGTFSHDNANLSFGRCSMEQSISKIVEVLK